MGSQSHKKKAHPRQPFSYFPHAFFEFSSPRPPGHRPHRASPLPTLNLLASLPTPLPRWLAPLAAMALALALPAPVGIRLSIATPASPTAQVPNPPTLPPAKPSPTRTVGFTSLDPALTGITFTNRLDEERSLTNQIFLNGSGVALGDVDGDGRCDIYLCGLDVPNALYRNLGGWHFTNIASAAGVACPDQASTGAALVDLDGDGDLDLLVNGIARGTRMFRNDGGANFTECTDTAGFRSNTGSASFAIGDVNGDGLPDVYVVNYRSETMRDQPGITFTLGVTNGVRRLLTVNGRPADTPDQVGRFSFDHAGGVLENGEVDALFLNRGNGRFDQVAWDGGVFLDDKDQPAPPPYDWGLSAMFRDLDGDGAPDLYVCNDFQSPDRLWINDGRGRFRPAPRNALRQTSLFSMGVDFADVDRDGLDDFFVADMLSREHVRRQVQVMNATASLQSRNAQDDRPQYSRNTLFRNRGNGTFAEIAQLAGVQASDWTWCPVFLDVDLDGFEDLLTTTGHARDAQDADAARDVDEAIERGRLGPRDQLRARRRFPRLDTPNFAFRNRGDLTFAETGAAWGFDSRRLSQSAALGDLDQDGDLDVVINCLDDGPLILRNDTTRPRLAIRLQGQPPNTRGLGSRVRVEFPGLPVQTQEMIAGGRYLGSDDPIRAFAAGSPTHRATVEVLWRSGRRTRLTEVEANQVLEIKEPADPPARPPRPAAPVPFFEDRSRVLGHQHVDQPFDDFAHQPLLPHSLAYPGPAALWFDFNNDGWEDLLLGAGRGGRIAVFRNDGQGGFIPQRAQVLQTPTDRDFTGLLGWRAAANDPRLVMGMDAYENPDSGQIRQLSLVTGQISIFPLIDATNPGPLAMADMDGDGDLDLFVGGRIRPGRYPQPARSAILRNDAGRLHPPDPEWHAPLELGLVNGALFGDLDEDGRPELVVACEWGPIRIFRLARNTLTPWDPNLTTTGLLGNPTGSRLSHLTGWWNSIAAGDLDGDGRMDLIAGNAGRNNPRAGSLQRPIRIHFGAFEPGEPLGLVESVFDDPAGNYVPFRDRNALGQVFPSLQAHFPRFLDMARASTDQLLAAGLPPMQQASVATLDSVILLNRGDHFEVRPLPTAAQLSPVFGIGIADFDGDGLLDAVLAQNFFGSSPAESRQDAGTGVLLRGDGRGTFAPLPDAASGLSMLGEGRALAVCDFDHDGRPDFVVGQNRGVTQLYRNVLGEPGLRLTLHGPAANAQAVGATARLEFEGGALGPRHEVRLGGGYWAQDSTTLVLPVPPSRKPAAIRVRWPNGTQQRLPVPDGELELEFRAPTP